MTRKEIDKIIKGKDIASKMLLLADHNANLRYLYKHTLTSEDIKAIAESIESPKDYEIWANYNNMDRIVNNAVLSIVTLLNESKARITNLRGYVLLWNHVETFELMINNVLNEIKDKEERERIFKERIEGLNTVLVQPKLMEGGFIDLSTDYEIKEEEYNLDTLIAVVKQNALDSLIKWISWEKALLDFMTKYKYEVPTYKTYLKDLREELITPMLNWDKYRGKAPESSNLRLKELIKEYDVDVTRGELKVREEDYNHFKVNILRDE